MQEKRNNRRRSHDSDFSPRLITKRVRTVLPENEDIAVAVDSVILHPIDRSPDIDPGSELSDLSIVTSDD